MRSTMLPSGICTSRSAAGEASSATSAALGKIAATTYTHNAGNGVSSQVAAQTGASADGKISMQMTDGSERTLLEPAKPVITLSEAAAALIDTTKAVQLTFTVAANGSVPLGDVRITPSSLLPTLVQQEIAAQISRWRFSQAATAAQARFDYVIRKD